MKQDKDIKDLLQGHFASYEAEPDRDLWSGIAAGLSGKSPRRRWVVPLWARYSGAIAASLLLLMGLIWMLRDPGQSPQSPMAQESPMTSPQNPAEQQRPDPELAMEPPADEATQGNNSTREPAPSTAVQQVAQQADPSVVKPQESAPQPVAEPHRDRRMALPGLETMTPLHRQVAIRQQMRERLKHQPDMVAAQPAQPAQKRPAAAVGQVADNAVATSGKRNSLDLNRLTLNNAVSFATNELSKWAASPVEIYTEKTTEREVRTYEFDLLNLSITRKVHRSR